MIFSQTLTKGVNMRVSIENFYVRGSANISNLWYEDGSFSIQRRNGSLFRISKDNTDKNLRGIPPEQVEEISKIGYFTIFESLGPSGNYSVNYTCRLLGGGNGPSHESNTSNANNDSPSNNSSSNSNDYACAHNDRPGVSIADIAEHAGNLNFGSAGRDVMDLVSGHESFGGFNQAPSSGGESSSSNSSSTDTSKTG
ncbi:MAG: hypothetical protein C5B45_00810 [Chlamydiae bacterium]|nr:MAG: hypothetical protein C5B45_00810 [Chlamydiota bacterium]